MKKLLISLIVPISLFFSCNDGGDNNGGGDQAETNVVVVEYDITAPRTWYADSVYILPFGMKVEAALTIEAGTTIKIGATQSIDVWDNGVINAVGSAGKPIVFTSVKDDSKGGDTNKDGGATTPAKGDWSYIDLRTSNGSKFMYCQFYYGGNTLGYGALVLGNNTSTVDNCLFAYNDSYVMGSNIYGTLYADNANPATKITNNTFFGNTVPLSINSELSIDNSNQFHNSDNISETNRYNGIFVHTQDILTGNVSWKETEVAFVVTYSSLELWENTTLTLANDVVLKFTANAGLELQNASTLINYNGTGVAFTSFKDDTKKGDTNGDGTATSPVDGDWDGVYNISTMNYYSWSNIYYSSN